MSYCNLCEGQNLTVLLDLGKHPIAHDFLNEPLQEEYVHPVSLYFCENCGLIQLINTISPNLLYKNYVCLSSWKYQPHIPKLIKKIKELNVLKKTCKILEVGSNDGRFLHALHKEGYEKLVGIEPANDAHEAAEKRGINTIQSYFNIDAAKEYIKAYGRCDIFISRQMLEHVSDLKEFREAMSIVLSPGGFVLLEVPNFDCNLSTLDYAIWEEHTNYFTPETLGLFLSETAINIIYSETLLFSGEALVVIGKYVGDSSVLSKSGYMEKLRKKAFMYRDKWPLFCSKFKEYLEGYKKRGKKIVVYGAGARLCSLINFIGLGSYIEFIVDDQPEKQGKYMPGSKLPILPSDALIKHNIDLCLLAVNAECEDKVIAKHPEFQKKGGLFISALPPSKRLPDFWNRILYPAEVQSL